MLDGRPAAEPGAIVYHIAPSFIRLRPLELPAARGNVALLRQLIDFTLARDFPNWRRTLPTSTNACTAG